MNYWQRWIGAWKKKTAALTLAERGAYTEMLDAYYANEGPLPAHDESLFRIVGAMTKAEQDAVCKVRYNKEFFTEIDGKLHNERADSEIARWSAFCDQQRQRRIGHIQPPRKPRGNGAHPPEAPALPDWLDATAFGSWMSLRPAKARTPAAQQAAIAKLEKFRSAGHDANAIVQESLANGWQGIFAPDGRRGRTSVAESNRASVQSWLDNSKSQEKEIKSD